MKNKDLSIAIVLSVIIHLLIFGLLTELSPPSQKTNKISTDSKQLQQKNEIKSYLYRKPIKQAKPKVVITPTQDTSSKSRAKEVVTKETKALKAPEQATKKESPKSQEAVVEQSKVDKISTVASSVVTSTQSNKNNVAKPKQSPTNSLQQLQQLRKSIDAANIKKDLEQRFATRSHSMMHLPLAPVPKSNIVQSREQKRQANTTDYGSDIKIIKGDNGFCSKEQKLDIGGSQSITTVQHFKCGESKDEKYFREHMAKHMARYLPKKHSTKNAQ